MVFGIWDIATRDILERPVMLSFYVILGDDHHLIDRDIIRLGTLNGHGKTLSLSIDNYDPLLLPTYEDHPPVSSPRTYLSILPTHSNVIKSSTSTCLSYRSTLFSALRHIHKALSIARLRKRLAHSVTSFYHLPAHDLETICCRTGILTNHLSASIRDVTRRCAAWNGTGSPRRARKAFLSRFLSSFSDHVQLDMFLPELTEYPILHTVDIFSSFSERILLPSSLIPNIISAIDRRWFGIYGSPPIVSGDVEFSRSTQFCDFLNY